MQARKGGGGGEEGKAETLIVPGGEDDGAGLVPDEALGDAGVAELGGNRVRFEHLDGQGVAVGAGLELVHLGEHGLPQARLRRAGRGRWRVLLRRLLRRGLLGW